MERKSVRIDVSGEGPSCGDDCVAGRRPQPFARASVRTIRAGRVKPRGYTGSETGVPVRIRGRTKKGQPWRLTLHRSTILMRRARRRLGGARARDYSAAVISAVK